MVKKYIFIFLISIILCVLQQAIFSRIVIFNVSFDIVLVFIICFTLLNKENESFFLVIICGLIRDSFFPYIFGINSILYIITFFIIILINKRIYRNAIVIPIIITFFLSIFKGLLYFAYFYISSIKFDFFIMANRVILYEALYNSVASILVYRLVKKVLNLRILKQDWKF
jgi:rod shape-determining protein MreD